MTLDIEEILDNADLLFVKKTLHVCTCSINAKKSKPQGLTFLKIIVIFKTPN